jgi:tetratricopeptide (TPR) repeat protein
MGNNEEALRCYQRELAIHPDDLETRENLGGLYLQSDRPALAVKEYEALNIRFPQNWEVANKLAWLLVSQPGAPFDDPSRAVPLAESACRATQDQNPICLFTLGVAYDRVGNREQSVQTLTEAKDLAARLNQPNFEKVVNDYLHRRGPR